MGAAMAAAPRGFGRFTRFVAFPLPSPLRRNKLALRMCRRHREGAMRIVQSHVVVRLLAVAGAVLLAGCAISTKGPYDDVDTVKVAQIERAARVFGTQVIWVNYPYKHAEATK